MEELLKKLLNLHKAYKNLQKAVPNKTQAEANAEQVFSETMTLLENPEIVSEINNILETFQNNSDNLDAPDQYLNEHYNDFIKHEIPLTKKLNLKRSEIDTLINTYLKDQSGNYFIENVTDLREKLQIIHNAYCEKIESSRDLPRKSKKQTKKKVFSGITKTTTGAAMVLVNGYFLLNTTVSPGGVVSCFVGMSNFSDGYEKLRE